MRLFMILSRPFKSLDEVNVALKYFERYGRLQEFSIRRDYFTRERDRHIVATYADEAAAAEALKTPDHLITVPRRSKNDVPEATAEQAPEEIAIRVEKARIKLPDIIKLRMYEVWRTNSAVQTRINQRMLRGFEGFNGELARLWDEVAKATRERRIKQIMDDSIKNSSMEGSGGSGKKEWNLGPGESFSNAERESKVTTLQEGLENVGDALVEIRKELNAQLTSAASGSPLVAGSRGQNVDRVTSAPLSVESESGSSTNQQFEGKEQTNGDEQEKS